MIFYRLFRIQAFIVGVALFGALLAFGWLVQHGPAILRVGGLIAVGLVAILILCVVAGTLDLQAQKRRDPAAYEERMQATRQRARNLADIRRAAASHKARVGAKAPPAGRRVRR